MGQVFTWDAVLNGRVPKIESFDVVASMALPLLQLEPSVHHAAFVGSYMKKGEGQVQSDLTMRSDLDVAVIYESTQREVVRAVLQKIVREANVLHVPLNFIVCSTRVAKTQFHHIGPSFMQHVQSSIERGGLIKGDFSGLLAPSVSAWAEVEAYIRVKLASLDHLQMESSAFSDQQRADFLKKVLEAPVHVARKTLLHLGMLAGDSKSRVRSRYREVMPVYLSELLDGLIAVDRGYTNDLECQLERYDEQQYNAVLRRLSDCVSDAIAFLDGTAHYLASSLGGT